MLASIDRYGDTTFNRMQIDRFQIEWDALFSKVTDPAEQSLLQAVKGLAE
jgi:hypothetical protein